jgi:hypothetical protein
MNASAVRVESDAQAQVARQATEESFDKKLLKQLDERDETIKTLRTDHAEEIKGYKAEIHMKDERLRDLNDRYYKQMEDIFKLTSQQSVASMEHNLAVTKAVAEARAEAVDATKRLHQRFEEQKAHMDKQDADLAECKAQHLDCHSRLAALEAKNAPAPVPHLAGETIAVVTTTVTSPQSGAGSSSVVTSSSTGATP